MKIPFKSKLAIFKNIESRNKAFKSLSDEDKRKEIAYDAITMILGGLVNAERQLYWNAYVDILADKAKDSRDLQNIFLSEITKKSHCKTCQRGILMISKIRLGNSVHPEDVERDCGNADNVQEFDMLSFSRMEKAFEYNSYDLPYHEGSNEKIINICCNIIKNGDFDTADKTDYLKLWEIKI